MSLFLNQQSKTEVLMLRVVFVGRVCVGEDI